MSDVAPTPSTGGHTGGHLNLGHKVGPLPVGAWVGAIAAGLAISWYLRRNGGGSSTSADTSGETVAPTEADTSGTGGAAVSTPGYAGGVSGPTSDATGPDSQAIETNAQWRQQAVKYLVGAGVGAIQAEQAVTNFLAGGTLTHEQADNINKAVAAIGPAPDAVPAISIASTPVAAPHPSHVVHKHQAKHKPAHHKDTGKHTHPRR